VSDEESHAGLPAGVLVPEGLELRRAGGRPPKVARDVGVMLARQKKFEEFGTYALADAWVLEHWKHHGLTDSKHVRDRCAAAKKKLPQRFLLIFSARLATLVEVDPMAVRLLTIDGAAVPAGALPGGQCWLWCDEMYEAAEARVRTPAAQPDLTPNVIAASLRRMR
jgi:hypothetical protein